MITASRNGTHATVEIGGWLIDSLPVCFAGDPFLRRFLGIFQELADDLRSAIDGIEHAVDADVAPPDFVRWLGGWLGVESLDPSLPELRQRELVSGFGPLLPQRGTAGGLAGAVELVTGERPLVRDPGAVVRDSDGLKPPEPVAVWLKSTGRVSEEDVVAVIRDWIPASATVALHIGGDRRVLVQGRLP
ncbi:MAG TPA: phage tail protein [Acidimicrobiia bacterium]|jgi:phage tail-like protein|nr:phage tail protein [Acidimicrobiia bacterium]